MRIAIDARHIGDHFPGIGRYAYALIAALADLDHAHELLVIFAPSQRNTRFDLSALGRSPKLQLVSTAARPFSLAEQRAIPRLLRGLRADIYHSPYMLMPYAGLPCPAVVTLYDVIPRRFPAEMPPHARLMFELLTRLALRASRLALTISESASADLRAAFGVPDDRLAVTPLAADERFAPQPPEAVADLRRRHRLPERYAVCLSSNKPHKGLPALVAAWAQLDPARRPELVIGGHFDARYPQARELAARLALGDAVRFLPDVAEADLPALYSGAEIFVFPSRYEGFGLPPLEAMRCGAPVLCGAHSSLPEVVGAAALAVDVTRPAAIAAGAARLLADAELRQRLRAEGLRRAAQFSWRATALRTLRAYERLW